GAAVFGGSNATNVTAAGAYETAQAAGVVPVMVLPSGDTSGATDQAAIQALLTAGLPVLLGIGLYYIKRPLVMQVNGGRIYGSGGCTPSGDDAGANLGTRIVVVSAFSNPSFSSFATGAIICITGNPGTGTTKTQGLRVRDLWIDGSSAPAGVDGIALYGPANAVHIQRVGADAMTGNGFGVYSDSGSGTAPDGTHWDTCLAQACGGSGWFGKLTDASVVNCHAQGCAGDGFAVTGGNNIFTACRADLCQNGYAVDHPGGSDGYDDYNLFVACTTQRNAGNGVLVTNSSAAGTQYRMPVKFVGCCFTGDGTSGSSFAGVWVEGVNQAEFTGCSVRVYTVDVAGGCPSIGIKTATIGTGPGAPTAIAWDGGSIQCASGGSLVTDSASVQGALRISPSTTGFASGYASSTVVGRTGSNAMTSGTVTVSNAWVTSSSRIFLTVVSRSGTAVGVPMVTSRGAGTFTITSLIPGGTSTQTGDTSTVAWQLVSQ
ncbi:MAG TPA: hypothetical protein VIZ43_10940, partial [Trebonia sp.]